MEFLLTIERKNELLIQGFDSTTQGLTELVEFCERLKTAKEIFRTQGEGPQENKKPSSLANSTNLPGWCRAKGYTRPLNPWKRMLTKVLNLKIKLKIYLCAL